MPLDPDAKLRIAPELRVTCRSGTEFTLELGPKSLFGGPHTLALLNAFRAPCSLNAALQSLKTQITGVHDWMDLTSHVVNLHKAGMLLDEQAWRASTSLVGGGGGFGSAPVHIAMLNDRERTGRYLEAIRATVRPGDVVVDMGTGSGVMAVAAAQAGAARVYAIEATGIAKAALRIFEANGVADRITLVEGYSTQIELPERADVLISEVIGNEPLGEKILECTADAVRRFLKPGARMIPLRLQVMVVPVALPEGVRDRYLVPESTVAGWRQHYGIDFSPLAALARNSPISLHEKPTVLAQWDALAESEVASDYDLTKTLQTVQTVKAEFKATRDGRIDAFAYW
ncbi:MAG: 50S ribosomal protein L11 methyltransferase, partial [Gammaproteobacteria bacterium]|nr:50S ribosomal protein L11 methyltransferase [Gammaproteobacteria bacterium]